MNINFIVDPNAHAEGLTNINIKEVSQDKFDDIVSPNEANYIFAQYTIHEYESIDDFLKLMIKYLAKEGVLTIAFHDLGLTIKRHYLEAYNMEEFLKYTDRKLLVDSLMLRRQCEKYGLEFLSINFLPGTAKCVLRVARN